MNVIDGGSAGFALATSAHIDFTPPDVSTFMQSLRPEAREYMESQSDFLNQVEQNRLMSIQLQQDIANSTGTLDPYLIYQITSPEGFRMANPMMAKYIMTIPELKRRYISGEVIYDGYESNNTVGHADIDYRTLHNGVVQEDVATVYSEDDVNDFIDQDDYMKIKDSLELLKVLECEDESVFDFDDRVYY